MTLHARRRAHLDSAPHTMDAIDEKRGLARLGFCQPCLSPLFAAESRCAPGRRPCRAFTLIELLIVVGILIVIMGAIEQFRAQMMVSGQRNRAALESVERADATLRFWREDVELARAIDLAPDGRAMMLRRADPEDGGLVRVSYLLLPGGDFVREIASDSPEAADAPPATPPKVLDRDCSGLRLERKGGAYFIRWESHWRDGLQTWKWSREGFAAPLLAAAKEPAP